jgi:hypothetical protein
MAWGGTPGRVRANGNSSQLARFALLFGELVLVSPISWGDNVAAFGGQGGPPVNKRLVTAAAGVTVALAAVIPGGAAFARVHHPPKPPPTLTPAELAVLCSSEKATYNELKSEAASTTDAADAAVDNALANNVATKYSANGCVAVTGVLV